MFEGWEQRVYAERATHSAVALSVVKTRKSRLEFHGLDFAFFFELFDERAYFLLDFV